MNVAWLAQLKEHWSQTETLMSFCLRPMPFPFSAAERDSQVVSSKPGLASHKQCLKLVVI